MLSHPSLTVYTSLLTQHRVFTLIITAVISGLLFVLGVYTPGKWDQDQLLAYQNSMLRQNNRWEHID